MFIVNMMLQTLLLLAMVVAFLSLMGQSSISFFNNDFILDNTLYVPKASQNLISASKFCDTNSTSIEFYPICFHVKDLHTRAD